MNFNLTYSPYVNKKYKEFYEKNGYIPEMFNPYNCAEITDIAPTLTAQGDSITKSGTVLILTKRKDKRMKVLSLFSGIGAFEKALKNLDIPFELVGYCEIDKYASKSYSAIHDVPETMNIGDITKIDERALPKDIDLITYGFPCQDISLAGKQKGLFNEDGTQTRSGLFFEALRIIEETQPKIAIAENVKNLVGKKFNAQFQVVLASLEAAGYNNYWQVLNAKNYGIPQNRERVFIVSIRKDIDTGSFTFPEAFPLELRLKDMLEDEVDERFYLTSEMTERLFTTTYSSGKFENRVTKEDGIIGTLCARDYKDPKCVEIENRLKEINCVQVGTLTGGKWDKLHDICRRVYSGVGVSPTIHTCAGGNTEPKVLVSEATKKGYAEAVEGDSINLEQPNSKTRRGRVGHGVAQTLTTSPQQAIVEPVAYDEQNGYIRKDGCVGTLTTDGSSPKHNNRVIEPTIETPVTSFVNGDVCKTVRASGHGSTDRHSWDMVHHNLRIRKLTPKECFRLMGFSDEDFAKAEAVNSNTQLYKQAGNSIVVDVIAHIFTNLKEFI